MSPYKLINIQYFVHDTLESGNVCLCASPGGTAGSGITLLINCNYQRFMGPEVRLNRCYMIALVSLFIDLLVSLIWTFAHFKPFILAGRLRQSYETFYLGKEVWRDITKPFYLGRRSDVILQNVLAWQKVWRDLTKPFILARRSDYKTSYLGRRSNVTLQNLLSW